MGWWPLIKLIPKKTNLKFVAFAVLFGFLSIAGVTLSFASMFSAGLRESPVALYNEGAGGPLERVGYVLSHGFNLGIDFKGGTLLELEAGSPVQIDALRNTVSGMGLGDVQAEVEYLLVCGGPGALQCLGAVLVHVRRGPWEVGW